MILVGLLSFHDFDGMGLDHKCTFALDLLGLLGFFVGGLDSLLFDRFLWNEVLLDLIRCKFWIGLDGLVFFKDGLGNLFQEYFDFWVTKFHHGSLKVLLGHLCGFHNLLAS